jgi:hypothetical protein
MTSDGRSRERNQAVCGGAVLAPEVRMSRRVLMSCWTVLTVGSGCNFEHLRYKAPVLSDAAKDVRVLELGSKVPPGCERLRYASSNNISGDKKHMLVKLQNETAEHGGNVLLLTTFNRFTSEGTSYRCSPEALAGMPGAAPEAGAQAPTPPEVAATPGAAPENAPARAPPQASTAAAGTEAADREARGLFLAGEAAYGDARYEDALDYFKRSYALSKRPDLLFNIGQAADKLRRDREALEAFEGYLREVPNGERRREAEVRVRILGRVAAD